jgi:hypothetical protein
MFKIFAALALIAGTVSAAGTTKKFVKAYTNEDTPREVLNLEDLFIISYDYSAEWTYGLIYSNERVDSDNEECTFSINTNSEITTNFYFDFLKIFHFKVGLQFVPFDITPFELNLAYVTPMAVIAGEAFGLTVTGSHDIVVADFAINYLKDIKLPTVSILDFLIDSSANEILPQWPDHFDFTNEEEYDEPYLSFDFGEMLFEELGISQHYGGMDYFSEVLV